jgi:PAS domain S-box-containing protein
VRLAISAWRLMPEQSNSGWFLLCYDIGDTPWWAVSTSLLRQVLEHTPVGIAVFDTELRYLWVNPELRRFSGVGLAERVGRTFRQVQPMMDVDAVEAALLRVLETGEPVLNWQVTGRTQVSPHETHVWSMSLFRLDDATDTPRGVCCVAIDVTSRWRAQERLALLAEAGARIGTTMDVSRTAQELADFAVPRLADFVTVDLFESLYRGDEPGPVSVRGMVNLRRAGQASVRRGVPEAVVRIGDLAGHWPDTPVSRCLIEGRPYLQKHIPPDTPWLARDPTRAARIR